jgi:small subunit ribosomal protein S1
MSWTKRVQHPSEVVHKGDDVEVVVLGVDPENKRISLGLKQTQDDPWPLIAARLGAGVEMDGRVVRLLEDGVVVDLGDEIEGFVPRSQVPIPAGKDLAHALGEGQTMSLRVIECDAANHRIVLTVTQMPEPPVRVEPAEPAEPAPAEGEPTALAEPSDAEADPSEEAGVAGGVTEAQGSAEDETLA